MATRAHALRRGRVSVVHVLLALLASLEMFASNLTTLFGQDVAASILLVGALANLVLRTITTQALAEK